MKARKKKTSDQINWPLVSPHSWNPKIRFLGWCIDGCWVIQAIIFHPQVYPLGLIDHPIEKFLPLIAIRDGWSKWMKLPTCFGVMGKANSHYLFLIIIICFGSSFYGTCFKYLFVFLKKFKLIFFS
jgi:hypothetical protein